MIHRFARLVVAVAAMLAWTGAPAHAVVTLSNGNFNTEFVDVAAPGALGMKIDRIYNSKADFTGMFGSRWSVQYEEYLQIEDDGSIVVHEYGGGFPNRFTPVTAKPRSLDAICDELTAAAEKLGLFASTKDKETYRAWVVDHHESEFEKFWELGLVKTPYLGIGQEFRSRRFGNEVLSSVPEGYQRSTDSGTFEEFNLKGKLVRVWDANHNFISLRYNAKGQLATMEDSGGNRFVFTFNQQNHVASIAWGNRVAHYEYKGSYLVKSVSVDGHANLYQYEPQYPYYLTQVHYSDGTDQKIAYYPLEDDATVKQITERDGTSASYQYDRSVDDRYVVTVTSTDADKKIVVNKYEYYYGHAASGDMYNSRMVQSLNGDVTDATYNPDHQPMSITKNGLTTHFAYDELGHLTLKQTAAQTIKLTYDPVVGKVTSVTTIAGDKTTVVSFVYDAKGNIVEATDAAGHDVVLTYDDNGHIATMTEKAAGTMQLIWDRDSKLVKVVVAGVGALNVIYKENGDFDKETSDEGTAVLQKIDAMYGAMIKVIKPPVVPLTF